MRRLAMTLLLAAAIYGPLTALAETDPPAEVMLFGVFHFANPGHDVVKTDQLNVMTPENQTYLDELASRIAAFHPTVILLEFDPADEASMQERYRQFLDGRYEPGSNEIYQLGFRIGKRAGVATVHSFDERSVGWEAEGLFEYMPEHDPDAQARMNALIEEVTAGQSEAHATKTLAELLLLSNDPEQDGLNKYMYVITNPVGAGDNFVGADAAASWWRRNFRMYANIQKYATTGERVIAIGGQGHTAILKDLLALDRDRVAVDVRPYITGE